MKKQKAILIWALIISVSAVLLMPNIQAQAAAQNWQKAYVRFLKNHRYTSYTYSNSIYNRFHLAYIDGDSVPELIFAENSCHAECAQVYTYLNGKVKKLGNYGEYGNMKFAPKKGRILSYYGGMGHFQNSFYKLVRHKSVKSAVFLHVEPQTAAQESVAPYQINGKKVAKSTYYTKLKNAKLRCQYRTAGYSRGVYTSPSNIQKLLTNYKSLIRK